MSPAVVMLADVARLLAAHGTAALVIGGRVLHLDGVPVAMVNASEAVVLSPVYRGADMALPARSAVRGDTAEILAALILARLAVVTREAA